ncbi:hypothetical protein DERF_008170 [Dermatophagoides farinae]|uniref:Uncharacterized protein n=1 Tax=Dermatophagoides farinae TaxID=6954 RepID=A0A922L8W5_DERFA|nr:hypothetical protein DERF_008170 [Dermatophagoides farinae]
MSVALMVAFIWFVYVSRNFSMIFKSTIINRQLKFSDKSSVIDTYLFNICDLGFFNLGLIN